MLKATALTHISQRKTLHLAYTAHVKYTIRVSRDVKLRIPQYSVLNIFLMTRVYFAKRDGNSMG